jgi:hypothetical protein
MHTAATTPDPDSDRFQYASNATPKLHANPISQSILTPPFFGKFDPKVADVFTEQPPKRLEVRNLHAGAVLENISEK